MTTNPASRSFIVSIAWVVLRGAWTGDDRRARPVHDVPFGRGFFRIAEPFAFMCASKDSTSQP